MQCIITVYTSTQSIRWYIGQVINIHTQATNGSKDQHRTSFLMCTISFRVCQDVDMIIRICSNHILYMYHTLVVDTLATNL